MNKLKLFFVSKKEAASKLIEKTLDFIANLIALFVIVLPVGAVAVKVVHATNKLDDCYDFGEVKKIHSCNFLGQCMITDEYGYAYKIKDPVQGRSFCRTGGFIVEKEML